MKPFWHAQSVKLLPLKPFSMKLRILMRNEGPKLRISQQAVAVNRAENVPQGEKSSLKDYSAVEWRNARASLNDQTVWSKVDILAATIWWRKTPQHLGIFLQQCFLATMRVPKKNLSAIRTSLFWEFVSPSHPPVFFFPSLSTHQLKGCWMY